MLKRFLSITLLTLYVSTGWVQAQETKSEIRTHLGGLGFETRGADYLASLVATPGGVVQDNNTYSLIRNAAGSANLSILKADGSDNTILNAGTGKLVGLAINGTDVAEVSSSGVKLVSGGVILNAGVFETVAAGTSVQGDGPLTAGKYIHLVTGFDETKVATLPACAAGNVGEVHFVLNNTTNKFAKIFPASGGQINSLGANAAYTQGVTGQGGKVLLCACQAANQWYCA